MIERLCPDPSLRHQRRMARSGGWGRMPQRGSASEDRAFLREATQRGKEERHESQVFRIGVMVSLKPVGRIFRY